MDDINTVLQQIAQTKNNPQRSDVGKNLLRIAKTTENPIESITKEAQAKLGEEEPLISRLTYMEVLDIINSVIPTEGETHDHRSA